ncbi:MAG: O-unit flippase-like protein [Bacteroidales bacterium]|nr:O-unit flippase-like protein [Bacteroidales bacterium]
MTVQVSKKDIIWGYFSQFFIIASGLITLPLILRMLTPEEIGLNYLMLTVGSLVSLFDFGFAPQFGRNITYVFSGAQKLRKEGIETLEKDKDKIEVNYHLLATLIKSAQFIYHRLAFIVLFCMLTFGSLYIYYVNNGFERVDNAFLIWAIYSASVYFNIYFTYYSSLLVGKGLIMQDKKAGVYSRSAYVLLTFLFLMFGWGLLGVVLANLISPFIQRFLSYYYFFTPDLRDKLASFDVEKQEKKALIATLWHNAKRSGLVFVGSYAVSKMGIFLAGFYLSLAEIGSYGLMMQLVGLIAALSGTLYTVYQPRFAALRIQADLTLLLKEFSFTMGFFYLLFIFGSLALILIGPWGLTLIGSNAVLPSSGILIVYCIIILLEYNHANFGGFITTRNNVPFVTSSLVSGACIILFTYLVLEYLHGGLLGIILVQGIVQLAYSNWKWPYVVCKEFNINFLSFFFLSIKEVFIRVFYGKKEMLR